MFIRFQGLAPDCDSGSKVGIFQLAIELRDSTYVPKYVEDELARNLDWLNKHLKSPSVLKDTGNHRAISWFRSGAAEPLKRIWAIKAALEEHGYIIDLVKTDEPGCVIYEDGWQVVAKPWRGAQKKDRGRGKPSRQRRRPQLSL